MARSNSEMAVCCSIEFGHPILRLRSGPFSVDTLVHAEQFLGLNGEGSITAPAAVRDSPHGRPTEDAPNIQHPVAHGSHHQGPC